MTKGSYGPKQLETQRKWRANNPEKYARHIRTMNLKKYGLTIDQYNTMFKNQKGLCAVCQKPELDSNQHSKMSLSVDHDHSTGKVRGLLCHRCNRALGLLSDTLKNI